MPFRGPAALRQEGEAIALVVNNNGVPSMHKVAIPPVPAKGAVVAAPPKPASFFAVTWPACALAGKYTYCPGPGGKVVRTAGGKQKEVAKGRPATRITAAPLGADHAVVAFLDERVTTEGKVLQAFAAFDEETPVRLSEDGAGATYVELAQRGDGAVAVYLDARTSMVPIHVRPVRANGGKLELQKDVVVAVGGPPERAIAAGVAVGKDSTVFALVPMAEDTLTFGLGAIKVGDPPREDTPIVWSRYPNGLDPAAVVATSGVSPTRVLRVRPLAKEPTAPRALELGRIDEKGGFVPEALVDTGKSFLDIALLADSHGSLWLLYGDANAVFLERRTCGG